MRVLPLLVDFPFVLAMISPIDNSECSEITKLMYQESIRGLSLDVFRDMPMYCLRGTRYFKLRN